jgi:recombination protein RecA
MKEPNKKESIAELLKRVRKEFGQESVSTMDSAPLMNVDVIPTGSYSVNKALGVGGLPRGRIVEIYGPEASGKTTLALSVIAQAQKKKGVCVYIDAENALDKDRVEQLGVNLKELILNQPQSAEEALNLLLRFVESGSIAVVVVDSVAALVPKAELEGDIGDQTIGLQARIMGQTMRKIASITKKTNTLVIFINQIRMKVGMTGYGGSPETTPGGRALGFYSSVRLDVRRIGTLKDGEVNVGSNVRVKVAKNRVGPPLRTAEFYIMYDGGISYEGDVFTVAAREGVITKEGHTYFLDDEKLGVSIKAAMENFKNNPELVKRVVTILEVPRVKKIVVDEEKDEELLKEE